MMMSTDSSGWIALVSAAGVVVAYFPKTWPPTSHSAKCGDEPTRRFKYSSEATGAAMIHNLQTEIETPFLSHLFGVG